MKTILFQGDSITEWHRNVADGEDLGAGYVATVSYAFKDRKDLRFINRGVSGDRLSHIRARWEKECLDLNPDILIFYAGVNDVLVQLYENFMTPHDEFLQDYVFIMNAFKAKYQKAKIIIVEPFMLNSSPQITEIAPHLEPIKKMVADLAKRYADDFIPLASLLSDALKCGYKPQNLAEDGVHLSSFGYSILTNAVINSLKKYV